MPEVLSPCSNVAEEVQKRPLQGKAGTVQSNLTPTTFPRGLKIDTPPQEPSQAVLSTYVSLCNTTLRRNVLSQKQPRRRRSIVAEERRQDERKKGRKEGEEERKERRRISDEWQREHLAYPVA